MRFCANCNQAVNDFVQVCPNCGEKISFQTGEVSRDPYHSGPSVTREYSSNVVDEPGYFERKFLVYIDFFVFVIFAILFFIPAFLLDTLVFPDSGITSVLVLIFGIIGFLVYFSIIPCYLMDGQTILMKLAGVKVVSIDSNGNIQSIRETMNFLKAIGFILYYIFVLNRPLVVGNQQRTGWCLIRVQR